MSHKLETKKTASTTESDLGARTSKGAFWSFAQTVGVKIAGICSQFVLAAILTHSEFGLVAIVTTITALAGIPLQLGMSQILIRRYRHFERWAEIAFWINLGGGVVGFAIMAISALPMSLFFGAPELIGLTAVAAMSLPLDAMSAIPQARLRSDLRFKSLAVVGTIGGFGTASLGIAFAYMGFGAYSIIIPKPIISLISLLVYFYQVPVRIRMPRSFRRWPLLLRDSRHFLVTGLFNTLLANGDYMLTGLFFSKEVLGLYYFAFNLSTQSLQLLGSNLVSVLLPSFAKLEGDAERQLRAYIKVCSTTCLIGMPLCVIQAALAEPIFHLLWGTRWDQSILPFQLLSIGMAFLLPTSAAIGLLQAQGRYPLLSGWTILVTLSFLLFVLAGSSTGDIAGVAGGVMAVYMISGPIGTALPMIASRGPWLATLSQIYGFPLAAVLGSAAFALAITLAGPLALCISNPSSIILFSVFSLLMGLSYIGVVLIFRQHEVRYLYDRVRPNRAHLSKRD